MATKSFLTPEEFIEAGAQLKQPRRKPDGDERKSSDFDSREFSSWLAEKLHDRLRSHPSWLDAGPVAIGSWARGELSPKSDVDLIFCGPEDKVLDVVHTFSRQGVKIRYRVPQDLADWTVGVEPFDVLALLTAVPLSPRGQEQLAIQRRFLVERMPQFRRELIAAMVNERRHRTERFDSISNFLEPNLKFGPGGLRDLEQALVTRDLFPERFGAESAESGAHAFDVLTYYKYFFLLVRQKLHLSEGAGEILSAPEQRPLSDWLGFKDPKDFMREIQKGVSRVSFYADWVVEQATRPMSRLKKVEGVSLKNSLSLFGALEADPSVLMQNRVRLVADKLFSVAEAVAAQAKKAEKSKREIGRWLTRFIDPTKPEAALVALFRSRLIDFCVPEFRRIVGHVQHDQYHRFTVDAHILQALRELKRIKRAPKSAGRLAGVVKSLTAKEWQILSFACLYHDIAKGREGDHSIEGIEVARRDLESFGKDRALIDEVCWIVREHLALSAAAFRENPHSPRTWKTLAEKGVRGRRLEILAAFTIVDIRATNPEAWTPWKERLLAETVAQFSRPEASAMVRLAEALNKAKLPNVERWIETLDPFLVNSLPPGPLVKDLKEFASGPLLMDLPLAVARGEGQRTWVRFHSSADRPGLFLNYVRLLTASGLSIRHASIHTDPEIGVYDWFEIKTSKTSAQTKRLLESAHKTLQKTLSRAAEREATSASGARADKRFQVTFDSVELVARDDREWVISFKGKDQSGALVEAARALFEEGVAIKWAKVHTWGRQLDDIFGVAPIESSAENLIETLGRRFGIEH